MTNEEAIKRLKSDIYKYSDFTENPNENEFWTAFDMAIKALEQQSCEDAISRQAVDILVDELARAISDERCCMSRGRSTETIMQDILELPPVTPQPKMGRWVKTSKAVMGEGYMWYCDKCEYEVYQDSSRDYPSEKYCPNCGAKMQEVIK